MPAIQIIAEQLTAAGRAPLTGTGTLTFRPIPRPINDDDGTLSPRELAVTLVDGGATVTLDVLPTGYAYSVTVNLGGGSYSECVTVADGDEYYHLLTRVERASLTTPVSASGWAVEEAARIAADTALDGRLDVVEAAVPGKQAADADLTAIAGLTPTNDDLMQRKAGAWTNRTPAQVKADLALAKGDVGLGNVDNVADLNKPVSTAQAAADTAVGAAAASALSTHTGNTSNPHNVTKTQVGLGNADNTADLSKPVSTAQQTALDLKEAKRSDVPAWVTHPERFDPNTSAYNLTDRTLARWNAALARTASGGNSAQLGVFGDSIVYGSGGSTPYTTHAWTSQLRDNIAKYWGDPGSLGWDTFGDQGNTTANPFMVISGFAKDNTRGIHQEARTSSAASQTINYGPIACAKFVILYALRSDGGQFTYAVDSGSTTTVDTVGTEAIASVTVTAATTASHTLNIVSLGANVSILAIKAVTSDTGRVVTSRIGRNGAKISNVSQNTVATSSRQLAAALGLDLAIIALETNDYNSDPQTALVTYQAAVEAVIVALQAVNCDIILAATVPPQVGAQPIPLASYTAVLYALADQYGCVVLDMQHRWVDWTTANASPYSYFADTLHPSARGHIDYARAALGVVIDNWTTRAVVQLAVAQSWTATQTFGYAGNSNEQLRIGAVDNISDAGSAATPYVAATSAGGMYMSAKAAQVIFVLSRMEMNGVLPFRTGRGTTAQRPSASTYGSGAMYWDTTIAKPIWSTGSAWVLADGTAA